MEFFFFFTSLVKVSFTHRTQRLKRLPAMQETWVQSLGQEDPLEKEMTPHSNTLAWRIPWTKEPGGLQFMGSQRVRYDRAAFTSHTECVFIVTVVLENSKPNSWLNNINLCGHRWPIQLCSVSIDSSFDLFFLILIFILCSFISQSYGLYFLGLCQILCGMR